MFSLVLIDDEYWALRGIREFIDWESYGFTDIRCFDSPTEALAHILEHAPDAVFTDIRMPPITGLDIMEKCHGAGLDTEFVVVSAYAEFAYAKRAIENGAFSYILKPLNREELTDVAVRLSAHLRNDRGKELHRQVRTLVLQALTGRSQAVGDLLRSGTLFAGQYRICAASSVPKNSPGVWVPVYDDLSVGILPAKVAPAEDQNLGISTPAERAAEAFGKFREALTAYYSILFYGITGPVYYHEEGFNPRQMGELSELIAAQKYPQAKSQLKTLLSQARERRILLDNVTVFYNSLILQAISSKEQRDLLEDIRPFSDCFQMLGVLHNLQTVQDCLLTLIDNRPPEEKRLGENTSDAIRLVIRYVNENFTQDLTLEQLARKYYISVSYLSRKFKQMTGENFSEYLAGKRIEYACQLLNDTDLSVAQVGTACGYPDCFYFSRIFKKVKGVPPSRFRENDEPNGN